MTSTSRLTRDAAWHRLLLSRWVGWAAALVVLLYISWPSFTISFALIDDHEIVEMVGGPSRLPPGQIVSTIMDRSNEGLGRFRPLYWVLRTLECATAGQDATWWYIDRFLLAAVTLTAIFVTVARFAPAALAALISLLPFVGLQAETWSRLGPNEAYAMPLLAVGAAVLIRAATLRRRPAGQWLGYGFLLASGLAKENFLPVAVLLIAWSAVQFGLRRCRVADWALLTCTAVIATGDAVAIAVKVRDYGGVYPQERSLQNIRAWLHFAVSNLDQSSRLTAGVCVTLMLLLVLRRRPTRRTTVGIAVVFVSVALLQSVFYAGGPLTGRYLYPIALLGVIAWTCAAHLVSGVPSPDRRVAAYGLIALALVLPLVDGSDTARSASQTSAATTRSFQANLTSLESQIRATGVKTVVIQPFDPTNDIEPTLSLARYLVARVGVNVMTLPAPQADKGYSTDLNKILTQWSHRGFVSISPYHKPDDCVSIIFGSATPVCARFLPPAQ